MERKKLIVKSKKKKNKSGGKRKGKNFEYEICKALSLNWTKDLENPRDDVFSPTDNSGGRATFRRKSGKKTEYQTSDLGFNDPIGKPLIDVWNGEMKSGYQKTRKTKEGITKTNWGVLDLLDGSEKDPIFLQFWEQCYKDAIETNREPILFFRRNNRQACIALSFITYDKLYLYFGEIESDYIQLSIKQINEDILIFKFSDFMQWADNLKGFIEEWQRADKNLKI